MATPQLVTGVNFVGCPTKDLEAAVEFYGSTVGLPRSVYLKERGYAEFETGNLTLSVYDAEAMGLEHPQPQPDRAARRGRRGRTGGAGGARGGVQR